MLRETDRLRLQNLPFSSEMSQKSQELPHTGSAEDLGRSGILQLENFRNSSGPEHTKVCSETRPDPAVNTDPVTP